MKVDGRVKLILGFAILIGSAVIRLTMPNSWSSGTEPAFAEEQPAPDRPQSLLLTPIEREAIRRNMGTMLRSLSLILHGLAVSDLDMVEQAARASGKAIAIEPDLATKLPPHFVNLDTKVHTRFDQMADTIKTGDRADLLKRLAALTGYCVACHEMYRVAERR